MSYFEDADKFEDDLIETPEKLAENEEESELLPGAKDELGPEEEF